MGLQVEHHPLSQARAYWRQHNCENAVWSRAFVCTVCSTSRLARRNKIRRRAGWATRTGKRRLRLCEFGHNSLAAYGYVPWHSAVVAAVDGVRASKVEAENGRAFCKLAVCHSDSSLARSTRQSTRQSDSRGWRLPAKLARLATHKSLKCLYVIPCPTKWVPWSGIHQNEEPVT